MHACMQAWCDSKGLDTVMHPIPKCVIFLEDLLQEMVDKKSKDPFGTIRVARKALSKIRYTYCSKSIKHGSDHCNSSGMVYAHPGNSKEVCLHPMVNSSARRP